jgi:hypothetical protein
MNDLIGWIAAKAERPEIGGETEVKPRPRVGDGDAAQKLPVPAQQLPVHQFPGHQFPGPRLPTEAEAENGAPGLRVDIFANDAGGDVPGAAQTREDEDRERERRIYRGRTVGMLRRYLRYSIEAGRLPSLLGSEFFRAKVTAYTVVTFEDRVIFVHDMEKCLDRLDEFSRQLIARHILQEHDRWATAKLLHCNEKTVRRLIPVVLDLMSEILMEVGLMKRMEKTEEKSCQGGENDQIAASDCEDGEYKF